MTANIARWGLALTVSLGASTAAHAACTYTGNAAAYVSCVYGETVDNGAALLGLQSRADDAETRLDDAELRLDGADGQLDEAATTLTGMACPDGWWSISGGRLCMDSEMRPDADMLTAILTCRDLDAHVCRHAEMQQACPTYDPYDGIEDGWYGDHARLQPSGDTDDEYLTWNAPECTTDGNNDGLAAHMWDVYPYRCCM